MKLKPTVIPPRQDHVEDPEKRFYVMAPRSTKVALENEAFNRGTDLWTLSGAVLQAWLAAGCPDYGFAPDQPPVSDNPPSSPSPSQLAHDQGDKA
ncbi:hypothetical protein SAMN05216429_106135 [Marinobacter persicus]|uniref:Uncharacterized protein n=1 Tax=Marinobacter persicus TaxID=930118 RepID=A0A1I3UGF3_9GAMM|nr:hypothetical protein [Marinobacter persicus]GHD52488.1 hypothetical protein GCM10008110_25350 [Marinobacter persicus]SFJ82564.1 hypothetical protein SAMN05216429_106135 [Marinobacter persicus]